MTNSISITRYYYPKFQRLDLVKLIGPHPENSDARYIEDMRWDNGKNQFQYKLIAIKNWFLEDDLESKIPSP